MKHLPDSGYAWSRLMVTLAVMTIGAGGMYVIPVVLPAVQADFGVSRADASMPYALLMLGWGLGGVIFPFVGIKLIDLVLTAVGLG